MRNAAIQRDHPTTEAPSALAHRAMAELDRLEKDAHDVRALAREVAATLIGPTPQAAAEERSGAGETSLLGAIEGTANRIRETLGEARAELNRVRGELGL